MKRTTALISIVAALTMILALMPGVAFADDVNGSFQTASNTPQATVTLYNAAGTIEVTSMTPLTAYTVKVNVIDADGLDNLTNIVLKLWYDAGGGTPTEGEFDSAAGHVQTGLVITWTQGGSFVLTAPTSTTWALGTCGAPSSLPGDFEFKFTVGKVATATTVSANWQVAAKVLDDDAETVFAYDASTGDNDMNWYGEITVETTGVDWGLVSAGMDFGEGGSSEETVSNVKYISNGSFNKKVSTVSTWSTTATLDEDGSCTSANEFALKADDTGTLSSAFLVTTTGTTIGNGLQTDESGSTDAENGLWLKLASTFAGGTFSGTITYTISS